MIEQTTPLDEMPLLSKEEGKPVPKARIRDAAAGRRVFTKMRDDDVVNAANRAECQDLLDGAPPWSSQELGEANIDLPNINWRGTEQQLDRAMAPYYRLSAAPEHAVKVQTTYGPEDSREEINAVLNEEITKTLRSSPFYMFQRLLRDQKKVKEGLGIAYHPDDVDWRFRAAGFGQFYFDRQKFACEEDQEVLCATEMISGVDLWRKTEGDGGPGRWKPKAVRAAVHKACKDESHANDWERLTDELKNNDLSIASTSPPVKLIHLWVAEFDGTVSHYIFTEVDTDVQDFLFEHRGEYEEFSEIITLFPDGLGTNAKVHGMRGLLYKIFPMEQQRNRSLCRYLSAADLGSSLVMQAQDENSYAQAGLQYFGNLAVIPHGFQAGQLQMPDLSRVAAPAIDMMERLRNDRVAGYTTENVFDGDQRKTKFEVAAHLDSSVSLSESQVDLHYLCEDRLSRQTVKRMTRRTYVAEDPGGREIVALHRRLLRKGGEELLEAFFRIDHTETRAGRAIGSGSAGARTLALERTNELRGDMDDTGRYKHSRLKAIDMLGSATANELFPPRPVSRTTPHTNIARLENEVLYGEGKEWDVEESDPHLKHARIHVEPLAEMFEAEKLGELPIEEFGVTARAGWLHAVDHVSRITGDEETLEEVAALDQFLQQVGEPIENGLKRARKMAEQAAEEEGAEEGAGGGGPTPEQIAEVERHNMQMRQSDERFAQEQRQRAAKAEQAMAIDEVKAAHKMVLDRKTKAGAAG